MAGRNNKVFQFFQKGEAQSLAIAPPDDPEGPSFKKNEPRLNWISATASGGGLVVLGDIDGPFHIMYSDMQLKTTFEGFSCRVERIVMAKEVPVLVGLGEEEDDRLLPYLKMWKIDSSLDYPLQIDRIPLIENVAAHALACSKDMSHVAVGLADGRILLFSGDLMRERGSSRRVIGHEKNVPITSLWFTEFQGRLHLFVTTTNTISSYRVTNDNLVDLILLDPSRGSDLGCSVLSDTGDLVVGDSKNLFSYHVRSKDGGIPLQPSNEGFIGAAPTIGPNAIGRGPKSVFERRFVSWFRRYCVWVEQDQNDPKASSILTIYDPKINIVVFSGSFDYITHIICEWSSILLLNRDCQVIQLTEIDTKTKMDTLCKKNNFPVALELAITSNLDRVVVSDIHQKYGDHLYAKRDFDGAITQYIATIGVLEPSYVIKRFLDAQRIVNLTNYLHKLHEEMLANSNHTTLLLNCYTKLSNRAELDAFLEKPNLEFDVETAIKVCRQAGYFHEALDLAKRKQRHDWYLKILLEDQQQHKEALDYLMTLPVEESVQNLLHYGKDFVSALPQETIKCLTSLWDPYQKILQAELSKLGLSGADSADLPSSLSSIGKRSGYGPIIVNAEDFITVFVAKPQALIEFLEFIVSKGNPTVRVCNTLLELYLRNDDEEENSNDPNKSTPESRRKTREEAAMNLLTNKAAKFDVGHALVLCQVHQFNRGILDCYEKLKLYNEILQFYMDIGDHDMVIRSCNRLGKDDPSMWVKALSYFASRPDSGPLLHQVLSNILTKHKSLPPLQVIRILAQSDSATLGIVRDHIDRSLKDEQRQIDEDAKAIKETREDTMKKKAEIQSLKTEAKIFRQTKCSACSQPLELPTVHFLCDHAFHLNCLMDENECSVCAPEIRNFMSRQSALLGKAKQHDEFFKMLSGSNDRFGVVAQYFGRSIFSENQISQPHQPSSSHSYHGTSQGLPRM